MNNYKDYIDIIHKTYLFKDINIGSLEDLITKNNHLIKTYRKNSIIHLKNEECKYCSLVLSGTVLIQDIDINGNVLTINEFTSSEMFGENLLFSNVSSYPMNVYSKTDTVIFNIDKSIILSLCSENEGFLHKFLESISNKTLILKNKVKKLSIKSVRECIADFLIYQYNIQSNLVVKLPKTKKELAEEFGIQRTSFSRELSKMKKDNLIDYNSSSITILDLKAILSIIS